MFIYTLCPNTPHDQPANTYITAVWGVCCKSALQRSKKKSPKLVSLTHFSVTHHIASIVRNQLPRGPLKNYCPIQYSSVLWWLQKDSIFPSQIMTVCSPPRALQGDKALPMSPCSWHPSKLCFPLALYPVFICSPPRALKKARCLFHMSLPWFNYSAVTPSHVCLTVVWEKRDGQTSGRRENRTLGLRWLNRSIFFLLSGCMLWNMTD